MKNRLQFVRFGLGMVLTGVLVVTQVFAAATPPPLWPGRQPDGSMLLPNQWSLRPAGFSVELGDFPVHIAVSPDGRYAAVLHCGYGPHEVVVVNLAEMKVVARTNFAEAFYGLTFSRDGRKLYCSGASQEVIRTFDFNKGKLTPARNFHLRPVDELGVPAGVAVDSRSGLLYAANLWNDRISCLNLKTKNVEDIPLATNAPALLSEPETPAPDFDTAAATKRKRAILEAAKLTSQGLFPYACLVDSKRDRLYVSLWGAAAVAVVDLKSHQVISRWAVGEHPCEMVLSRDGKSLFVANANDNTVTVLDPETGRARETLWATLFPNSPRGATPNSVALLPDGKMLFVANANINAVAVFDVTEPGRG
ncbi:MAG TPA: SMP-30/gluconolactonase/LRE family protein, partial [Dongiaceae bacterium]|nr:SMP-30/gluconolactonase/LRE family protein [Dongiaceae bacterium]